MFKIHGLYSIPVYTKCCFTGKDAAHGSPNAVTFHEHTAIEGLEFDMSHTYAVDPVLTPAH